MLSLNYEIFGNDLPYVQVTLAPSTEAIAEQGAMMYVDQHIVMSVVLGDGSASKFGVIGRFLMRLNVLSRVNLCLVYQCRGCTAKHRDCSAKPWPNSAD